MAKLNKEEALAKVTEGKGEFHVSTIEEHESFLTNLKDTDIFKEQIDGRVREIYQRIDSDVSGITGEEKASDEKTYDYVKRQLSQLSDNAKELTDKKAELEKAVNDKSGSETIELLKSQVENLKKKYDTYKEESDLKYGELEKSGVQMRIMNEFDRSITGLKFKDATIIPEDVRNAMINNSKTELAKQADYVDGKLVFRDSEGKIMYNDQAQLITAKDILSEKLKSVIDQGRKIEGVDIEEPSIEEKDGKKVIKPISLPDSVKTNADLTKYLMDLGMTQSSEKYRAYYAEYKPKLKEVT